MRTERKRRAPSGRNDWRNEVSEVTSVDKVSGIELKEPGQSCAWLLWLERRRASHTWLMCIVNLRV